MINRFGFDKSQEGKRDAIMTIPTGSNSLWSAHDHQKGLDLYAHALACHKENKGKLTSVSQNFVIGESIWADFTTGYGPEGIKPRFLELTYQRNQRNKEEQVIIHIGTTTSFKGNLDTNENIGSSLFVLQVDQDWENILACYPISGHNNAFKFEKEISPIRGRMRRSTIPNLLNKEANKIVSPFYGLRLHYRSSEELVSIDNLGIPNLKVSSIGIMPIEVGKRSSIFAFGG